MSGDVTAILGQGGMEEEYPPALAARVASRFCGPTPMEAFDYPEKGNINQHTYLIQGGLPPESEEFLLQQINQDVFRRPQDVMESMIACIESQRSNLSKHPEIARDWEVIELIPTREEESFLVLEDRRGTTFWRLMRKIGACRTFKSLGEISDRKTQLRIASEAGRGLAIFGDLTADMDISDLENPLPGYRETGLYYAQLDSVLEGNRSLEEAERYLPEAGFLRDSTAAHFLVHLPEKEYQRRLELPEVAQSLELILENREFAMSLLRGMEEESIRRVAIHGDTKLDNFLFDREEDRVKALVDLDTIMPHSWLADWGDMVRSLANVAGEKERDLTRISVDLEVYEAIARGFLSTAQTVEDDEVELMAESVQIIALELGLRFLTDYLRGDNYFRLSFTDPPDLNRVRGLGQLALFENLREMEGRTQAIIEAAG